MLCPKHVAVLGMARGHLAELDYLLGVMERRLVNLVEHREAWAALRERFSSRRGCLTRSTLRLAEALDPFPRTGGRDIALLERDIRATYSVRLSAFDLIHMMESLSCEELQCVF